MGMFTWIGGTHLYVQLGGSSLDAPACFLAACVAIYGVLSIVGALTLASDDVDSVR